MSHLYYDNHAFSYLTSFHLMLPRRNDQDKDRSEELDLNEFIDLMGSLEEENEGTPDQKRASETGGIQTHAVTTLPL